MPNPRWRGLATATDGVAGSECVLNFACMTSRSVTEIVRALNAASVRYLVVGGLAVVSRTASGRSAGTVMSPLSAGDSLRFRSPKSFAGSKKHRRSLNTCSDLANPRTRPNPEVPYASLPDHGPQIANVIPGSWMFTKSVPPSREKQAPANSTSLYAFRASR